MTYVCVHKKVTEHICIEPKGFAKQKADHWVKYRGGAPCDMADELMEQIELLQTPKEILVKRKGKYYDILNSNF